MVQVVWHLRDFALFVFSDDRHDSDGDIDGAKFNFSDDSDGDFDGAKFNFSQSVSPIKK